MTNVTIMFEAVEPALILDAVARGACWITDTPTTRSIVEGLWKDPELRPGGLTLFQAYEGGDVATAAARVVDNVDTHHPDWTRLEVQGAALTPDLEQAFADLGPGRVTATGTTTIYTR